MTSRSEVRRTVDFAGPAWLVHDFPEPYGTDFAAVGLDPSPDARPSKGPDEWGAVWDNIGVSQLGEVKEYPLKEWSDLERIIIPDALAPHRWKQVDGVRARVGEKYLFGSCLSIYERVHFLRGVENTWVDIYDAPAQLRGLIDLLADMNIAIIEKYAAAGVDAIISCDDWGLQDRLMIDPRHWREFWKPAYARMYKSAHERGLQTFLHSCGYIVDIIEDLIEIGLDAVHMDQQANMGLELLGRRFGGRINFYAPVDIQTAMHGSPDTIRAYARAMVKHLGSRKGGFMPRWYTDPKGAGHTQAAIDIMCSEFLKIGREIYGR